MFSLRDPLLYLDDILESIQKIQNHIAHMSFTQFVDDIKTQDAILMRLQIIGESSNKLDQALKKKYSYIPWTQIAGLRHLISHDYDSINLERIWNTLYKDIPKLHDDIQTVVKELENKA
ncbi:MAG: DUF86 domain-containing protein [Patescibacteria group bacterium]